VDTGSPIAASSGATRKVRRWVSTNVTTCARSAS
jgi:hypothetical protein